MRLVFQSNLYTTGPTVVLPFIASVVYILLTFAFLIFASRNFILGLGRTEKHDDKAYSHSIKLLAGIPGVLLARYSSYFLYVGFRNTFMAWGTILSLILSGAAIITLIALAFFRKWHERKINIPLRIATCVLSVIAICMTFVPIMKTTINAEFSGTNTESEITIPIYPSLIAGFDMTELQWSEINDIRGGDERQKKRDFYIILNNFEDYTKPQINSGLADEDNMKYLIYMTAVDKSDSFITMISMTSFVYYAFAIFLSMVLQENLRCLIDGKYSRIQSRIGKIAGLVCACAILAVTLVLLDVIVDSLYIYSSKRYSIALSAGSILTVVFAAASLVIPGEKKNAVVVCDADNDEEEEEDEEDEED